MSKEICTQKDEHLLTKSLHLFTNEIIVTLYDPFSLSFFLRPASLCSFTFICMLTSEPWRIFLKKGCLRRRSSANYQTIWNSDGRDNKSLLCNSFINSNVVYCARTEIQKNIWACKHAWDDKKEIIFGTNPLQLVEEKKFGARALKIGQTSDKGYNLFFFPECCFVF